MAAPRPLRAKPTWRYDWKMSVLVVLIFAMAVTVGFTAPFIVSTGSTTKALDRGSEVTGCRAEANGVVTNANAELNDANTEARRAELANEILTNTFIEEVSTRDVAAIQLLLPRFAPARERILQADAALEVANSQVQLANDAYQQAVQLSQNDRDEFLRRCRAGDFPLPAQGATTSVSTPPTSPPTPFTEGTTP